ncbi:MAG: hypothetical protein PHR68_01010 [Candidatus Gracilibacteria bacterium]|nr:hypothetical protein [Candidatus Gracilibacteria bacterium]
MTINIEESLVELGDKKNGIKNHHIRQLIDLGLITKDEYLSLKGEVDDKTIIEGLGARAIKSKIKSEFDKIMTPGIDKGDKL